MDNLNKNNNRAQKVKEGQWNDGFLIIQKVCAGKADGECGHGGVDTCHHAYLCVCVSVKCLMKSIILQLKSEMVDMKKPGNNLAIGKLCPLICVASYCPVSAVSRSHSASSSHST